MAKQPNLTKLPSKTTATAAPPSPAPEAAAKPKRHPDKVQMTLYLAKPLHKTLKLLAVEHETNMHALVLAGIDKVLRDYGSKSIAELTEQA